MAEATGATTSTATDSATTVVTDSTTAPAEGKQTATESPKGGTQESTAKVGGRQPTAMDRAAAAIEKHDSGKATEAEKPEGEAAKDEKKDEKADAKPEDKQPEKPAEEKKEDPRLAKTVAILAEREERVRVGEKKLANERAEWQRTQQAEGADLKVLRDVRAAVQQGNQLAALELLGIDLKRGIELMSQKAEPSAEDIQRRIIREEFEAREKAAADATAKAKAEAEEKAAAADAVAQEEFLQKAFALPADKYPFTLHRKVTGAQLWEFQKGMQGQLGRPATAVEVLDRIESALKADYEAAQKYLKPAEPAVPQPKPAEKVSETPKAKAPEKAPDKPAEQQSRRPLKRESASARADAALKRAGYH